MQNFGDRRVFLCSMAKAVGAGVCAGGAANDALAAPVQHRHPLDAEPEGGIEERENPPAHAVVQIVDETGLGCRSAGCSAKSRQLVSGSWSEFRQNCLRK